MAWPYDARDKSYSANVAVPSSNLNAIQDEAIAVAGEHEILFLNGYCDDASWDLQHTSTGATWVKLASGDLHIPIPARSGAVLQAVKIKYLQTSGSASWTMTVRQSDIDYDNHTTVPTDVQIAYETQATAGAGAYQILTIDSTSPGSGSMPVTYDEHTKVWVRIQAPTVADEVTGVLAIFDQYH